MPPEIEQSVASMHKPHQQQQQPKISAKPVTKHGMRTIVSIVPSKLEIHPVSKLDSALGNFFLHTVLFFDAQQMKRSNNSWDNEGEELNLALAKALDLFPVLSGRLRVLENGSLGIKTNDSGIRLIEASCDSNLRDWLELESEGSSLQQQLVPEIRITDYSISPLCAIQCTKFFCGGAAIAISWCHILADLMSMDHFIKIWGEQHRNKKNPRSILNREPASQPNVPEVFDSLLGGNGISLIKPNHLESRVFQFSSKSVEELVKESAGVSELEAICALVWRSVVRAHTTNPSPPAECSRLCLWMNPGKKDAGSDRTIYFGNAATEFKLVESNWSDLISQSTAKTSRRIQGNCGGARAGSKCPSSFFAKNVLFCNWSANVPCYESEFGFGKPMHVDCFATSVLGETLGIVTIAPGANRDGGMSVFVSVERDVMKRLLLDDAFGARVSSAAGLPQKSNCGSGAPSTAIISAPAA